MKLTLRFFISWIISAIVMYLMFYAWHGIILNDFKKINFPLTWLFVFSAIAYITISVFIYLAFESKFMKTFYNFIVRGLISGAAVGLIIFIISTVVTISISKHLSPKHLMFDCIWQISEQAVGGLIVALVKVFVPEHHHEEA